MHAKGAAENASPKSRKSGVHAADQALSTVLTSLEDSKAEDIVTIDIKGKSALGDHMLVVSGRSNRHVMAICDHLVKDIKQAGIGTPKVEGQATGDWVLIDAGDVIVHVFRPEVREFYNIEKMWSAPEMNEGRLH
nr:ribosome silencing factor [Marinicella sp. W31]MDC2879865.1 ribosome silencing factor [Marinicella sp. W31]